MLRNKSEPFMVLKGHRITGYVYKSFMVGFSLFDLLYHKDVIPEFESHFVEDVMCLFSLIMLLTLSVNT